MRRDTLLDFFEDLAAAPGDFLVFDDGFRSRTYSYAEIGRAARRFAARLHAQGLVKGDTVILWGENRPEWVVALWGCLLRGVVGVPIDYRASVDFLERVRAIVAARLVLAGEDVSPPDAPGLVVWPLAWLLAGEDDGPGQAPQAAPPAVTIGRDDVAEIIFTSGATAEPKGVVITHRNVLANIVPIELEVRKYRRYGRPFFPLRFLNLLPLSHMFGQAMATFVPPMLPGVVVFMRGYNPQEIARQIRTRRVSVLVCVPKILDVLRDHLVRRHPEAATPLPGSPHWSRRWWHYRAVHRELGWKFWAVVVGAAPLEAELEEAVSRLGYLVIQGYGLTETAPIVTLNHPFAARKGSVGKPIAGVQVKVAADGEILVRGDNVTQGYYHAEGETAAAFEDGWLRTGDIGEVDAEGRVYIRGRKKEMIVTPEGLNVFPEDVERALLARPGVRDAAVVGRRWDGEERVHGVLVLEPGTDAHAVMAGANATLADHQRLRSVSVWPEEALPRTEGTRKLKRRDVRAWVEAGEAPAAPHGAEAGGTVAAVVARFAHGTTVDSSTEIDALGLSSLERVELLMALEEQFETTVDETAFAAARTVADVERAVASASGGQLVAESSGAAGEPPGAGPGGSGPAAVAARRDPVDFPTWNRGVLARGVRRVSLPTWMLPLSGVFARVEASGLEHLDALEGPVVFAANHQSHFDAPAILTALPPRWRYRTAIAMAKEFFEAHFFPERFGRRARLTNGLNYYLAALFFNAFPLPQREAGTRRTLRYVGDLLEGGQSVLIFPEGKRTDGGEINAFRPGVAMIGARLGVPVVPVRIEGLDRILHHSWRWPARGRARVAFGPALRLEGENYPAMAAQIEAAVRRLQRPAPSA
jgi:long-chain acyl-CoA synthetase